MVHDCIRRLPPSPPHIDAFITVFDLSGYGMANRCCSVTCFCCVNLKKTRSDINWCIQTIQRLQVT